MSKAARAWREPPAGLCAMGVALAALAAYLATLAPELTFEHHGTDGGDLIAAACTLGVPHPTGYPTYTLLAWLFSHLPIGSLAYRINLLSAVCAALAVGLLFLIARQVLPTGDHPAAVAAAAALTLAFSSLFWSQAVIGEVYTLLALFAALLIWLLLRWRGGGSDSLLGLAAFTLGLGLGNHVTLILAIPAAVVLLWPERRRWLRVRSLATALLLFLAGLAVYVYLPLAAVHRPPVNWGNPQTWRRFLWVVTARQYQGFAFGLAPDLIPGRLAGWAALLGDQFGWWGLAIALAGLWGCWQRDRHLALFALAWMAPVGIYAFFYDTGDAEVYLLPVVLLMALWWGEGAGFLLSLTQRWRRSGRRLALGAILLLPLALAGIHWQAADLSRDRSVRTFIQEALGSVEPGGLVVVRGDRPTFALWYAVYAEGQRPDVALVSGPLLAYTWYREQMRRQYSDLVIDEPTASDVTIDDLVRDLIAENDTGRPVYAIDPSEAWERWFRFVPVGEAPIYAVEP